jgi:hypothetical protein
MCQNVPKSLFFENLFPRNEDEQKKQFHNPKQFLSQGCSIQVPGTDTML